MGTAFEVLDIPTSDRSLQPAERPLTQWAFDPPPPNPPRIGVAMAGLDGSQNENYPHTSDLQSERPITQWFPDFDIGEVKPSKDKPQDLVLLTACVYNPDAAEDRLLSPMTPGPSSASHASSASVSPSASSHPSPVDFPPETKPSRPVQFPKRSTSLSHKSRPPPPQMPSRPVGESFPMRAQEIYLRRTQSSADSQKPVDRRGTPPQLIYRENHESIQTRELSYQGAGMQDVTSNRTSPPRLLNQTQDSHVLPLSPQSAGIQDATRNRKSPPRPPLNKPQDAQVLPPLTSAPPNMPLPPISGTKLAGQGKTRHQLHRRGSSSASDRTVEMCSPTRVSPDGLQRPGTKQKLTPKERFWLHRQYRGEASFLQAWGLDIANESDRDEGLLILRELMEGEAQEERERESQEKLHMHHRSGSGSSMSRPGTATSPIGLDVIAEEMQSREFPSHSATNTISHPGGAENESQDNGEQKPQAPVTSFSARRPRLEKHSRTESEDSVVGASLDLRLSHPI